MPFGQGTKVNFHKVRPGAIMGIVTGWVLIFSTFGFALSGQAKAQQPQSLPESPLIVETDQGLHHFTVQLANTDSERSIGLMYRREMATDHGMLFDMGTAQQAHFWMKNTYLPLDIIFIRTDGRISNIEQGVPMQLSPPVLSKGRILGVLELNAGTAVSLGIGPGDIVRHPIFGNWPKDGKETP